MTHPPNSAPSHPVVPATAIRAVVFDCFGVLYEDALKEFIEHYDLALASDRGHIPDHQFYAELSALSGEPPEVIQRRLRDMSVLNRQVLAIIESLRPHYKIGLLSNAERSFLDHFLGSHQLQSHFDVILASSETAYVKPQQPIFEELARRLALAPSQIIFIDDALSNATAAVRSGMAAIHYQNPHQLRQELAKLLS